MGECGSRATSPPVVAKTVYDVFDGKGERVDRVELPRTKPGCRLRLEAASTRRTRRPRSSVAAEVQTLNRSRDEKRPTNDSARHARRPRASRCLVAAAAWIRDQPVARGAIGRRARPSTTARSTKRCTASRRMSSSSASGDCRRTIGGRATTSSPTAGRAHLDAAKRANGVLRQDDHQPSHRRGQAAVEDAMARSLGTGSAPACGDSSFPRFARATLAERHGSRASRAYRCACRVPRCPRPLARRGARRGDAPVRRSRRDVGDLAIVGRRPRAAS